MSDFVLQGRRICAEDLSLIRDLIAKNPSAHRSHLSLLLCELWNWRTPTGQLKDIAARTLLRKLEGRFRGTCYRAANWTVVGRTKGRSRQDRHQQLRVPPKLTALLPLARDWRQRLLENPSP